MKQKSETNKRNPAEKYFSPAVEVITVNSQNVLCLSGGNESLSVEDFGNGGFTFQY